MKIELGRRVRDKFTGFSGIAVSRTEYLWDCPRVTVQPETMKDGIPITAQGIDEPRLEVVEDQPAIGFVQPRRPDGAA